MDPIVERAPCEVVIFKDCGKGTFQRVLVPVAGGPNGALALEIASILVSREEGEITAFTVSGGESRMDLRQFVEDQEDRLAVSLDRIRLKEIHSRDVVRAILAESESHDLLVLGSTRNSLAYQVARTSIPELIARQCSKPLVMVKAATGLDSWLRRWI